MSVTNVKESDIEEASWMDDVDKAAKYLQDIADISSSSTARLYLTPEAWLLKHERIGLLRAWLKAEKLNNETLPRRLAKK